MNAIINTKQDMAVMVGETTKTIGFAYRFFSVKQYHTENKGEFDKLVLVEDVRMILFVCFERVLLEGVLSVR